MKRRLDPRYRKSLATVLQTTMEEDAQRAQLVQQRLRSGEPVDSALHRGWRVTLCTPTPRIFPAMRLRAFSNDGGRTCPGLLVCCSCGVPLQVLSTPIGDFDNPERR